MDPERCGQKPRSTWSRQTREAARNGLSPRTSGAQSCRHLDFGPLASTLRGNTFLWFQVAGLWDSSGNNTLRFFKPNQTQKGIHCWERAQDTWQPAPPTAPAPQPARTLPGAGEFVRRSREDPGRRSEQTEQRQAGHPNASVCRPESREGKEQDPGGLRCDLLWKYVFAGVISYIR